MADKNHARKRRGGGRFFAVLIFLILAGGAVFMVGWVQFRLDEGEYGVIYTKIGLYDDEVVINGDFDWRAEALIPTNLNLHVFHPEVQSVEIRRGGVLPSGDLYADMAGLDFNFDWEIEVQFRYRLNPDSLPSLMADGHLAAGMDGFYSEYEKRLDGILMQTLADEIDDAVTESVPDRLKRLERALQNKASALDHRVNIVEIIVQHWALPDPALYREARRLTLDFMRQHQAVVTEVETAAARRQDDQEAHVALLTRYGKVLTDYPVLLELFTRNGQSEVPLLSSESLALPLRALELPADVLELSSTEAAEP